MYYYIRGELVLIEQGFVVIDAGGVGYRLTVSSNTLQALPQDREKRKNLLLYTHYSVREDGTELYGFTTLEELNVFRLLISVSGVGPKAAMSVLSFMTPEKLALCVSSEDKKSIAKAPNIGPKTAARIILELKDKLHADLPAGEATDTETILPSDDGSNRQAAIEALLVLGFTRQSANEALRGIDTENTSLEDIVRDALKKLMK